jgi:hypothetical protein
VIAADLGVQVRPAPGSDAGAVAILAGDLARSFAFSRAWFDLNFADVLAAADSCLLVAVDGDDWATCWASCM